MCGVLDFKVVTTSQLNFTILWNSHEGACSLMGAVSSLFIRILVFGFAVNFKLLKITWEFSFWHCLLLLLCVNTRVFCETNFYYRMKKGVGARSLCVFPLWLRLELIDLHHPLKIFHGILLYPRSFFLKYTDACLIFWK